MLYAFDGTGNRDNVEASQDTNVVRFRDAYDGQNLYYKGIGTRWGVPGAIVGKMTGAGGRGRVSEAYEQFKFFVAEGDAVVDIIGFSRGAALALHFANEVAQHPGSPAVRFLGIWDCVPSFGAASIPKNIGWKLGLPANVEHCFHALALDERRHTFRLHRPKPAAGAQPGVLCEVWFAGVHSDVGGGNKNVPLSSIALQWMLLNAQRCGLPIKPKAIRDNASQMVPGTMSSGGPRYDLVKNRFRRVRPEDQVHASVAFRVDKKKCNNPPVGVMVVDDTGHRLRDFEHV
jgi:uncharacterized protein (DUF2235 family)